MFLESESEATIPAGNIRHQLRDPVALQPYHNEVNDGMATVGPIAVSSDEEGIPQQENKRPKSGSEADSEEVEEVVIFRMPHRHPHMLKRPLQHADGVTGLDFAIRLYAVASKQFEDGVLRVHRQRASSDILLMELLSSSTVSPLTLIKNLKQWSLRPEIEFDEGAPAV